MINFRIILKKSDHFWKPNWHQLSWLGKACIGFVVCCACTLIINSKSKYKYQFHNLIVLSSDPLARRPSPSKPTLSTEFSCPFSVLKHSRVFVFHNLIVLSSDPLARRPSASKLTLLTKSSCSVSVLIRESITNK